MTRVLAPGPFVRQLARRVQLTTFKGGKIHRAFCQTPSQKLKYTRDTNVSQTPSQKLKEAREEVHELRKTLDVDGKWLPDDEQEEEEDPWAHVDSDDDDLQEGDSDGDEEFTAAQYFDDYCPTDGSAKLETMYSEAVEAMEEDEQRRLIRLELERDKALSEMAPHEKFFERLRYTPTFPAEFEPTDVASLDPTPRKGPGPRNLRRCGVIGQKIGKIMLFDEWGMQHRCTVVRLDNVQVTWCEADYCARTGYYTQQVGYGTRKLRQCPPKLLGHYNARGIAPKKLLKSFQCGKEALLPTGTELTARHFMPGQFVDVQSRTRGWGFQGVMKKWNFRGGPASHGSSLFHRRGGSLGGSADPGKVWKGKKMPGKMGNRKHTTKCLRVFRVDPQQNLLYILGRFAGIPPKYCTIRDSFAKPPKNAPFPTFFPHPDEVEPPAVQQMSEPKVTDPFPESSTDAKDWLMRHTVDMPF